MVMLLFILIMPYIVWSWSAGRVYLFIVLAVGLEPGRVIFVDIIPK